HDRLLERAAFEVMPEPLEARAPAVEIGEPGRLFRREPLRIVQPLLGGLALGELAAIVLGEMLAALALLLLGGELRDEALQELASRLPELAQLIEGKRRKGRVRHPEPRLEGAQHLLHA